MAKLGEVPMARKAWRHWRDPRIPRGTGHGTARPLYRIASHSTTRHLGPLPCAFHAYKIPRRINSPQRLSPPDFDKRIAAGERPNRRNAGRFDPAGDALLDQLRHFMMVYRFLNRARLLCRGKCLCSVALDRHNY